MRRFIRSFHRFGFKLPGFGQLRDGQAASSQQRGRGQLGKPGFFPADDEGLRQIVRRVFLVRLKTNEEIKRQRVAKVTGEGAGGDKTVRRQPVVKKIKVGPNDPCPCGSGKKYKKCCRDKDLAAERGQQTN